jgi:hypothetical protein
MTALPSPQRVLSAAEADALLGHLVEEADVQEKLLDLLKLQEKCLVSQDLGRLAADLAEAAPLLDRMEDLTRRRARVVHSLARALCLSATTTRVSARSSRSPRRRIVAGSNPRWRA